MSENVKVDMYAEEQKLRVELLRLQVEDAQRVMERKRIAAEYEDQVRALELQRLRAEIAEREDSPGHRSEYIEALRENSAAILALAKAATR